MKPTLILLFLTILLLCGLLLRAANNSNPDIDTGKADEKVTQAEANKNMEFTPNIILL